jgi:aspartyl-tRNA(Asn)/glutamyl-tRNA(Gln) amidotransferase subunit B
VSQYEAVIGLEIHAQLLTKSKIFCGCSTAFGAAPNTHLCPVCLGLPGALPVLNHAAVDCAIRAAVALGCEIQATSIFARKNYFYPDLPKGYQISQYEQPLATGGVLRAGSIYWTRDYDIRITRIHMEEDAGKLLHEGFADSGRRSYVDLNRAGTPLIEIVTEPDFRSGRDAAAFFEYLRELLVALRVNDGNMEEGSLRCDANVSVRPRGSATLGTKVEIKNLNSFAFLEDAIEYEAGRQIEVIQSGGRVVQETRLWDTSAEATVSMRSKEEAHDYRYFPDPDLPALVVDPARLQKLRDEPRPKLRAEQSQHLVDFYGLNQDKAMAVTHLGQAASFEEIASAGRPLVDAKTVQHWLLGPVQAKKNELDYDDARFRKNLSTDRFIRLLVLEAEGTISGSMAKDVFEKMYATGRTADEIIAAEGLAQIDDESQIVGLIDDVLAKNADAVAKYRAGATATFGFLVGQVMKAAAGKANPKRVNELLKRALGT